MAGVVGEAAPALNEDAIAPAPAGGYNAWMNYDEPAMLYGRSGLTESNAFLGGGYGRGRRPTKRTKIALEEMLEMSEEQKQDNYNDLQKAFQLIPVKGRTYINAVVYDKNKERHTNLPIPCHQGTAFDKGYAYDQASDSYIVNAHESVPLGYVPIAYELKMPDSGNWHTPLPLPPAILDRYYSAAQRKTLTSLRERYSDTSRFTIEFVQMMGCET